MFENLSQSDLITIIIFVLSTIVSLLLYKNVRQTKFIFLEKINKPINNYDLRELQNLRLTYQDEEIDDFLYLLKGTIIMVGDHDVKPEDIYHPICFKTNDNDGRWKDFSIRNHSDLLENQIINENNGINIRTGIIKKNDFMKIEAFYNGKMSGYSIQHRILNVNKSIHKIYENKIPEYFLRIILMLIFFFWISYKPIKGWISKEKNEITETITVKDKIEVSKVDSIRFTTSQYNTLYYIRGEALKYDSIFHKNYELNQFFNSKEKIKHDSLMNEKLKGSEKTKDRKKINLEYKSYSRYKDSTLYEDTYSLRRKKDSVLVKLLEENNFQENKIYKLSDTISVSFSLPSYLKSDKDGFVFDFILEIIPSIVIMILSVHLFFCVYNLYYLIKLKSISN